MKNIQLRNPDIIAQIFKEYFGMLSGKGNISNMVNRSSFFLPWTFSTSNLASQLLKRHFPSFLGTKLIIATTVREHVVGKVVIARPFYLWGRVSISAICNFLLKVRLSCI